jgi:hypothetical protein
MKNLQKEVIDSLNKFAIIGLKENCKSKGFVNVEYMNKTDYAKMSGSMYSKYEGVSLFVQDHPRSYYTLGYVIDLDDGEYLAVWLNKKIGKYATVIEAVGAILIEEISDRVIGFSR